MTIARQIRRALSIAGQVIAPIIHDTFNRTGSLNGSSPDTVDNGNLWEEVNSSLGTLTCSTTDGGQCAVGGFTGEGAIIDSGVDDTYVVATVQGNTTVFTSNVTVFSRVNDLNNNSFPTDCVYVLSDHELNILRIFENTAGTPVMLSTAWNPPEATPYEMTVLCEGSLCRATAGGGAVSLETTLANQLTGSHVGIYSRSSNSIHKDFKTYPASAAS